MKVHRCGFGFVAAVLVALSIGCKNKETVTEGPTPATVSPAPAPVSPASVSPAPAVTVASAPDPTPTLYAWANPISGVGSVVDHTWVTSFAAGSPCPPPQSYWFSWGSCHETGPGSTARPLVTHAADLAVAKCICTADLGEYLPANSPSHGGINLYGIDGVCHQLSNRILWAATKGAGDPVTVEGAKGYAVSRWAFGVYGVNVAEWQERITHCTVAAAATPSAAPGAPVAMEMKRGAAPAAPVATETKRGAAPAAMAALAAPEARKRFDAELGMMVREKLGPEVAAAKVARVTEIRSRMLASKEQLNLAVRRGAIPPREFAVRTNDLIDQHLAEVAQTVTPEEYRKMFGIAPGDKIQVVDPAIAEKSRYQPE